MYSVIEWMIYVFPLFLRIFRRRKRLRAPRHRVCQSPLRLHGKPNNEASQHNGSIFRHTVCFLSTKAKENSISQPPGMLDDSAIAHSKGLSMTMAFMLYFQPKFKKNILKVIYGFFP